MATVDDDVLSVLFLDVGQGDASLVLPPGARGAIVFDCRDARVVMKHLDDFGIARIEAVVFSHLDADHIGGGLELLRTWHDRVDRVFLSTDGRDLTDQTDQAKTAKDLFDFVTRPNGATPPWEVLPVNRDPRPVAEAPGDWKVSVIAPEHRRRNQDARSGDEGEPNEYSAVLRIERAGRAVVVGADAPLPTWSSLTKSEVQADVFRVPHHGGALDDGGVPSGWSAAHLYQQADPEHAVISVGTGNRHDHPRPDWVRSLVDHRCRVSCTQVTTRCHTGADHAPADWREIVLSMRGRAEPAWVHLTDRRQLSRDRSKQGVPCAGTIAVGMTRSGGLSVRPTAGAHDRIIDLWDRPWCRHGFPTPGDAG